MRIETALIDTLHPHMHAVWIHGGYFTHPFKPRPRDRNAMDLLAVVDAEGRVVADAWCRANDEEWKEAAEFLAALCEARYTG